MHIYIYCLHSDSNLYPVNLIYLEKDEKEGFVKVCAAPLDKLDDDAPSEVWFCVIYQICTKLKSKAKWVHWIAWPYLVCFPEDDSLYSETLPRSARSLKKEKKKKEKHCVTCVKFKIRANSLYKKDKNQGEAKMSCRLFSWWNLKNGLFGGKHQTSQYFIIL